VDTWDGSLALIAAPTGTQEADAEFLWPGSSPGSGCGILNMYDGSSPPVHPFIPVDTGYKIEGFIGGGKCDVKKI
jgi:hypothetical protein